LPARVSAVAVIKRRSFFSRVFGGVGRFLTRLHRVSSPRPTEKMRLGRAGERAAANFLKRRGFRIVRTNWSCTRGEIDIIAVDVSCSMLVFVEVRLRSENSEVLGYFSIGKKKKSALRAACSMYLRKFAGPNVSHRFDVIEVEMPLSGSEPKVFHYENVPLF
jgi:putative endonuclease